MEGAVTETRSLEIAIEAKGLRVELAEGRRNRLLLRDINIAIPKGAFTAIIGPSGCGKSTLLRSLAGIQSLTSGRVLLAGHPVESLHQQLPLAIGYLGQFGSFHSDLTVLENLRSAVSLRLSRTVSSKVKRDWLRQIIELAGLQSILDQPYKTLSGGQKRRIALAEELIGDPAFLFLDELTSGLDEFSDQEMMLWLRDLAHRHQKTIILVTHATYHLNLCDSVVFLNSGHLIQHGSLDELFKTQNVSSTAELLGLYKGGVPVQEFPAQTPAHHSSPAPQPTPLKTAKPPNGWAQFPSLLSRQFTLFSRDRGQLWIQGLLILIFPALVAVFATSGLPQVRNLTLSLESNILRTMQEQLLYMQESFRAASLISGLAMFQVVLLTLMGANNSAREIAKDRNILSKEQRTGLSPVAYTTTKFLQVALLSAVQSLWMTWFVKTLCGFPGDFAAQFIILFATTLAMATACLAISAGASSPERASLLSIYLVGFQMPLSGAALALPLWLSKLCQPFIAAYWGWSGYLRTFQDTRHYDIVKQSSRTELASYTTSLGVLSAQTLIALLVTLFFVGKRRISHIDL